MIRLDVEPLGHQRDHVGLADGLPVADRGRPVGERGAAGLLGEEQLARDRPQGVEHALVADAALDDLLLDHPLQRGKMLYFLHNVETPSLPPGRPYFTANLATIRAAPRPRFGGPNCRGAASIRTRLIPVRVRVQEKTT